MTDENIIPAKDATTDLGKVSNPSDEVGLVRPIVTPVPHPLPQVEPPVVPAPLPRTTQVHTMPGLRDDIASILAKVQMPERRGGGAGTPVKKEEPKIVPVVKPATTPPEQASGLTTVHTFRDDLNRAVQNQRISVIKAASLEEEKRHREKPEGFEKAVQKKSRLPLVFGILSTVLVIGIATVAFLVFTQPSMPTIEESAPSLMFSEQSSPFPATQETGIDIKRTLAQLRGSNLTLGAVVRIVPVTTAEAPYPITAQEFIKKLDTRAPDAFTRALGDVFFLGIHTVDINAPVLVLSIASYENAFAGMLAWEENINEDLAPLFTQAPLYTTASGTPVRRAFTDEIIKNYDIRALRDDSGKIVFYYAFPSRNILIIAESPFSFTEVVTRLKAQRAL